MGGSWQTAKVHLVCFGGESAGFLLGECASSARARENDVILVKHYEYLTLARRDANELQRHVPTGCSARYYLILIVINFNLKSRSSDESNHVVIFSTIKNFSSRSNRIKRELE